MFPNLIEFDGFKTGIVSMCGSSIKTGEATTRWYTAGGWLGARENDSNG